MNTIFDLKAFFLLMKLGIDKVHVAVEALYRQVPIAVVAYVARGIKKF
jgi:hypothetical protein